MSNHAADRHSVDHRFLVLKQLALLAMGDVSSDSAGMGQFEKQPEGFLEVQEPLRYYTVTIK